MVAGGLLLRPYQETENGRRVSREHPATDKQRATTLSVRRLQSVKAMRVAAEAWQINFACYDAQRLCGRHVPAVPAVLRRSASFCIVLRRAAIGRHRWRQPTPECQRLRVHIINASNTLASAKLHCLCELRNGATGARQILKPQASDSEALTLRSGQRLCGRYGLRSQGVKELRREAPMRFF